MNDSDKVRCRICGKKVYWFELGDATNSICYDCIERMNHFSILRAWFNLKAFMGKGFVYIAYAMFGIAIVAFLIFWISGCTANFLNVDDDPAPGLHWKP